MELMYKILIIETNSSKSRKPFLKKKKIFYQLMQIIYNNFLINNV